MKAVRVIKVIAFVLCLVFTAFAVAGNVMVLCVYEKHINAEGVSYSGIREDLKNYEFKLSQLTSSAKAEEDAELDIAPAAEVPAEEPAVEEPATEEPATEEPAELPTVVTDILGDVDPEDVVISDGSEDAEPFDFDSYPAWEKAIMKYSTAMLELKFMRDVEIFGSKMFADNGFYVNWCLLIAFALLFVAFVLHCISKRLPGCMARSIYGRHSAGKRMLGKTVYGEILMVVGYLIFLALTGVNMLFVNAAETLFVSLEAYDFAIIRVVAVPVLVILSMIVSLPIYRCGSRQMVGKELKLRLAVAVKEGKRLKNKAAAAKEFM